MAGVSATGGVKMPLKLEVVSRGNTNCCTECIQMSKIDGEPHSLLFSSGASFGVLSVNIQSSKFEGPFACVPVGNSNVQAVEIWLDPPNGQQIVTLST